MLSALFGTKIEKELKALLEQAPELEVRYQDGETFTVSRLLKVYRNKVVLLGFTGKLKKPELRATFLANGAWFNTKVVTRAYDNAGRPLFYCKLPEALSPPAQPWQKHRIKGAGEVRALVSTNRGERSMELPIWECSSLGMTLINATDVEFRGGAKFFQALTTIGGMKPQLVDLQVASSRRLKLDGKLQTALTCAYLREPRALSELLAAAKSAAPPPPAPRQGEPRG